ncbi:MAG: hypothetical protein AB8B83_03975 [Bdellovibrionales bacterium]
MDKPPGSAVYEFADVPLEPLPDGSHQLVGTLNGVPIYLADPCLDFSNIDGGENYVAIGHVTLWENEYSSMTGTIEFESFDASELGDFIAQNHERLTDDNALRQSECMVVSSVEMDVISPSSQFHLDLNRTI